MFIMGMCIALILSLLLGCNAINEISVYSTVLSDDVNVHTQSIHKQTRFYSSILAFGYVLDAIVDEYTDNVFDVVHDSIKSEVDREFFSGVVKYSADRKTQSSTNKNETLLTGNALVEYSKNSIVADKIRLNFVDKFLYGIGGKIKNKKVVDPRVLIRMGGQPIFSDDVLYGLSSNIAIINNATTKYDDLLIRGQKVKKDFNNLCYGKNILVTTCRNNKPHWGVVLHDVVYKKDREVLASSAHLMLGGAFVPIPLFGAYWFAQEKKSGFLYPSGISRDNHGFYVKDLGYYIYLGECVGCTLKTSVWTDFSFRGDVVFDYVLSGRFNGSVSCSFSNITNAHSEVYYYDKDFQFNCGVKWKHNTLSKEGGDFCVDIDLRSVAPDGNSRDNKDKKNFKSYVGYSENGILFGETFKACVDYNKDFSSGLESIKFPSVTVGSPPIYPLFYVNKLCQSVLSKSIIDINKVIEIIPTCEFLIAASNEKIDYKEKKPWERENKNKQVDGKIFTMDINEFNKVLKNATGGVK